MFKKLLLPLTLTVFVATATAANPSATTDRTPEMHGSPCALSTQSANPAWRETTGRGLEKPRLVAVLEMGANSARKARPSSCYPALGLATTSIPSGTVGTGYAASLSANGGQPPYRWSLGQSSLPSGFSLSLNGDLTGTPATAGTYQFNVVVSDSLQDNVTGALTLSVVGSTQPPPPPPPALPTISAFTASPATIGTGGSAALAWSSTGGSTATLAGSGVPLNDPSYPVHPSATTSYVLTVTNSAGSATASATVTVNGSGPPPPPPPALPTISAFTASPATIGAGGSTTLAWSSTGGSTATLAGSGVPLSDPSYPVDPSATTTYVLTVTNSAGNATASATVTVSGSGPPPPPPQGKALTACGDITKGGTYYLANDVSSAGTCFGIDANGVTLNLNSHTITYDTGGTNFAPAIEAHDCWSANPTNNGPCGSAHGGLEVYGGTIVQAANATSTFSPVFSFGQSNAISPAPYIHDITATFQNPGAQFYFSEYVPAGARIANNTIYDNVTSINKPGQGDLSSRAAFQGQAIGIHQNRNNPGVGDVVTGNKIVGSPQGGMYSDNQYTVFNNNDVSMNATYSNDFCEAMAADHQTAEYNNCHPLSGRGFHTDVNYSTIANNTISVIELKQNREYGGCELAGTYAVQVEFDNSFLPSPPVGTVVTGNTITATSGDCQAIGLRVTGMTPAGNVVFSGNTVTTTNNGTAYDFGISTDGSNNAGVTFTGNTFNDQFAYVDGDWDGYNNTTVGHNTWLGTPKFTMYAGDGGCDPTQSDPGAACPVNIQFTDTLPNTVNCVPQSTATVTIGSQVTVCKPNQ